MSCADVLWSDVVSEHACVTMQARHGQLNAMGWFGSIGTAQPAGAHDMQNSGELIDR